MKFADYLNEEFNQLEFLPDALEWLNKKFPKEQFGFTFKHKPNLINETKTYNISINDKEFDIAGRLMDTNSDGKEDTVLFRILSVETEKETPEASF